MPSIIQDEKQAQALKEIEAELSVIEQLNIALSEGASYTVSAKNNAGKTAKVEMEEKEASKLNSILAGYKARLAKDIQAKAKANRILLSNNELEALK